MKEKCNQSKAKRGGKMQRCQSAWKGLHGQSRAHARNSFEIELKLTDNVEEANGGFHLHL